MIHWICWKELLDRKKRDSSFAIDGAAQPTRPRAPSLAGLAAHGAPGPPLVRREDADRRPRAKSINRNKHNKHNNDNHDDNKNNNTNHKWFKETTTKCRPRAWHCGSSVSGASERGERGEAARFAVSRLVFLGCSEDVVFGCCLKGEPRRSNSEDADRRPRAAANSLRARTASSADMRRHLRPGPRPPCKLWFCAHAGISARVVTSLVRRSQPSVLAYERVGSAAALGRSRHTMPFTRDISVVRTLRV